MGRPPGAKNGTAHSGTKSNNSKPPSAGGGKGTSVGAGSVEKATQDRSQSNFPYDIRLNGFASLQNAVSKGTPRVKRILTEECDYIMECRVCRNLFRSLPNFMTHKLNYCKKAFDSTWCIGLSNLIQTGESPSTASFNIEYEIDPELVLVNTATNLSSSTSGSVVSEGDSFPTRTRSVADLYNELAEKSKVLNENPSPQLSTASSPSSSEKNVIRLQLKPLAMSGSTTGSCNTVSGGGMKSVVVQQQVVSDDPSNCDNNCTNPVEIVRNDTAVLGPDGKVLCTAPAKGIEQVVSRLTAQLKALEEKEAQKMAALSKASIICDICKTVFDSDKALRQHKRESLDCGKIWGFKSPHHDKSFSSVPSESSKMIPNKRAKIISESEEDTKTKKADNASARIQQSTRLSRIMSPTKTRRTSHHNNNLNGVNMPTNKFKRNLSLSPVKKIKMKYIKLDSSSTSSTREVEIGRKQSLACNRCSSSFPTKHEMSMHLALCTGVINYAHLKEIEPPQEKIRISQRNDFPKVISTSVLTPRASPSASSFNLESQSQHVPLVSRERQMSGASSGRADTPTVEVNNNKQYKSSFQPNTLLATSSSSEEDSEVIRVAGVPSRIGILRVSGSEEVDSDDITSHDSGVSSASSTKKGPKKLISGPANKNKMKGIIKPLSSKNSPSASVSLLISSDAAKKKVGGGMMSARLEGRKRTVAAKVKRLQVAKAFNLRQAIKSRIRKSRRIQRPTTQ